MRSELVDAVIGLIRHEGIEDLTMAGVARQVGVAKGTVYLYFDSKEELIGAALAAALEPLVEQVEALLDSGLPADEKLEGMARANLEYFDEHRMLFQVFMHERYLIQTEPERLEDNVFQSIHSRMTRTLEEGAAEGLFRAVDAPLTASIWLESLTAVILHRLNTTVPAPLEHDLEQLTSLFRAGLAATR